MYIVTKSFDDLCDPQGVRGRSYHRYKPGDVYPRRGYKPTSERVRALLSGDNALGVSLIEIKGSGQEKAIAKPEKTKPTAKTTSGTAAKRKGTGGKTSAKKPSASTKKTDGTSKKTASGSRTVRPVSRLNK